MIDIFSQVTVYPNFISNSDLTFFKDYANHLFCNGLFNKAGPNRYSIQIKKNSDSSHIKVHNFYNHIANFLSIEPSLENKMGIVISLIKPNGFIYKHIDATNPNTEFSKNKKTIRFCVMVDRDVDNSYNPIINESSYNVNIGDAWCFPASEFYHRTDPLVGTINRIVYRFSFSV